jgi:DNA-binding cell septation regulator SpoVG
LGLPTLAPSASLFLLGEDMIKHMQKVNKEGFKTKAFFALETTNWIIYDMRLVEGKNGFFASFPARKYKDKNGVEKFQPIVACKDVDLIKVVTEEAVRVYNNGAGPAPEQEIPF